MALDPFLEPHCRSIRRYHRAAPLLTLSLHRPRLGPYPLAYEDSWETLLWVSSTGIESLQLDSTKVVIGGQSAGANLAAVAVHRAIAEKWVPILRQLLLVPIMDNTATVETNECWSQYQNAPGLSAEKMLLYRKHYVGSENPSRWEISPMNAPAEDFRQLPKAIIVVADVDILRGDGERYLHKMVEHGGSAELITMAKLPHAALTLGGRLEEVEAYVTQFCQSLKTAFSSSGLNSGLGEK